MNTRNNRINCWDYKQCGRELGGTNTSELGVCPSATETKLDGIHHGTNGGRTCWCVAGTFCGGTIQGTFSAKLNSCLQCDFFRTIAVEEGDNYHNPKALLQLLAST